jgi:hypothetical protein
MQYFPYSQEKLFGELQQCLSFSSPLLQIIGEYSLSWVDNKLLYVLFHDHSMNICMPWDNKFDINKYKTDRMYVQSTIDYGIDKFLSDIDTIPVISQDIHKIVVKHVDKFVGGLVLRQKSMIGIGDSCERSLLTAGQLFRECKFMHRNFINYINNKHNCVYSTSTSFTNYVAYEIKIKNNDTILIMINFIW